MTPDLSAETLLSGLAAVGAADHYLAQARRHEADSRVHDRDGLCVHAAKCRLAAYLARRAGKAELIDEEPTL